MQRQPGDYTVLPQVHLFGAWWNYGAVGKQREGKLLYQTMANHFKLPEVSYFNYQFKNRIGFCSLIY